MRPPTITGRDRLLLNALAAALVLRLLHLDELSLWVDEGVTWSNATTGGWRDTVFSESNHPPVWWLVTRAWLTLFPGSGEAALRMPAAIAGVVAVYLAYRVSLRLSGRAAVPSRGGFAGGDGRTALWVALLATVNPFWIEYAQEARMYAALLAESLGLTLLYLRWLDRGGRGPLVGYAVLASVALHTNYYALWPIAGHAAHALLAARGARARGERLSPVPLLVAQVAAGLSFVPWFLHMLSAYRGISPGEYEPLGRLAHALWRMAVGPALVALDAPRVRAGPAAVFAQEPVLVVTTALLWLVPIAFGVRAVWRDRGARAFLGASVLVPVALVLLACVRWPLVHEKYLIFLAPFLLHLAVEGGRHAPRALRPVLLGGLVLLHAAGLVAYHLPDSAPGRLLVGEHRYGKEQWREAHALVRDAREAGDVVLLHAPFTHMTWAFYDRDGAVPASPVPSLDLPCDRALEPADLLARFPALREAKQAFLVLSHPATDDPDHYRGAVFGALVEAWGGVAFDARTDDVELPRQWGVRVLRFRRP